MSSSLAAIASGMAVPESDPRKEPLRIEGKRCIVRDRMAPLLQLVLGLAAAHTLGWYSAHMRWRCPPSRDGSSLALWRRPVVGSSSA